MKDPKAEPIKIVVHGCEIIDIQVEMGRPPTIPLAIAHLLHREKRKTTSDSKEKANPSLPTTKESLQLLQHETMRDPRIQRTEGIEGSSGNPRFKESDGFLLKKKRRD